MKTRAPEVSGLELGQLGARIIGSWYAACQLCSHVSAEVTTQGFGTQIVDHFGEFLEWECRGMDHVFFLSSLRLPAHPSLPSAALSRCK